MNKVDLFTIYDLLNHANDYSPENVAVVDGLENYTYRNIKTDADKLAGKLIEIGVRKGNRVVINMQKSVFEIIATFAIAKLGAVFININPGWSTSQLHYVIKDSDASVLISDRTLKKHKKIISAINQIVIIEDIGIIRNNIQHFENCKEHSELCERYPNPLSVDLATLMYTSGSTGLPKGVMLTNLNLLEGARIVSTYLNITSSDKILGLVPMSFDYGLNQLLSIFLVQGIIVLQRVNLVSEIAATIIKFQLTGIAAVYPTWIQLSKYLISAKLTLSSVRYITNTGGRIPKTTLITLPKLFPKAKIYLMYGLTEAFRATYLKPELFEKKMGSIGRSVPNNEVFVINDTGLCEPGEEGELIQRGVLLSKGYWKNKEKTDAVIKKCNQLYNIIGDEKVLFTGDTVKYDEDGDIWFVGRKDGLIKCSGHRISPDEVEEIIYNTGKVKEVVAFGVADDELGEVVNVALTWANKNMTIDDFIKTCRGIMPTYMVPGNITVWENELLKTPNGKIDRLHIVELAKKL